MPKRQRPGVTPIQVMAHVEEVVLASSGEDPFELVFSLAAARLLGKGFRRAHPSLEAKPISHIDLAPSVVARVDALVGQALDRGDATLEALDAVFEALVSRVAKSHKGQFFTPRHVVEFVVRVLAPRAGETVVDPACGSGAFLAHALSRSRSRARRAGVAVRGVDIDPRAVRVARLMHLARGGDARDIVRADGLRTTAIPLGSADVVATNPPFAGRADASGFEVAGHVRTPERDVLFLERALALLAPGGRLGVVLPYNKVAGLAFDRLRGWLFSRARVLGVVGLPRETFLPHTSQRCVVLFARRRAKGELPSPRERTTFALSEASGKDSAGAPNGASHDLDELARTLRPMFARGSAR